MSATGADQTADLPGPDDAPELYDTLGVDVRQPDAHTDADPDAAVEAIQRPQTYDPGEWDTPDRADGELPRSMLPGFGEEKPSCGDPVPHMCAGCGHTTTVGDTCRRLSCPRCVESAIRERTREVCARLGALRAMLDARRDPHQKYHHVVFSPPKEWILLAKTVYAKTVDVVKELFKVMGLVGWYAYHPWAGEDGDDRGFWKRLLNSMLEWSEATDELKHRPHFHAIAIADKVPGGDFVTEVNDRTDWVIARIVPDDAYHDDDDLLDADLGAEAQAAYADSEGTSSRSSSSSSNVSIYGDDELARVVSYIISHTGLERKDTPNGEEWHLQANYIGSLFDFDTEEMRWWPEVINTDEDDDRWQEQLKRMDATVRAAAPTTLGVAAADVSCAVEWADDEQPDHDYHSVDVVGSAARSRATPSPSSSSSSLDAANDVPSDPERVDAPDDELDQDPEPERCSGRLVHIAKAHRYLDDPQWLEAANDPVHVLSAYRKWVDEHPDALDNVDTTEVIERAERRLGVG